MTLESHGPETACPDIRLSVIIVTWNIRDVLRDCLESLFKDDLDVAHEVILVDNGSNDGTREMLTSEYPQIKTILNDENLGFPKGNNQGIAVARGDYILLLNSDTVIIDPTIFSRWVKFMDENPEVGASGCRVLFPDRTHQVGDAGYKPTLATVLAHNIFLNRLFPSAIKGLFVSYRHIPGRLEVDWITGADLLVRRDILAEVGLLDEDIFIYAEDIEWGCRIRSFGYKVIYLPDQEIVHLQGATTRQYPELFSGMDVRNLRQLYKMFNPRRPIIYFDLLMSFGFLLRTVLYAAMIWQPRQFRNSRVSRMFQYLKFCISNIGS